MKKNNGILLILALLFCFIGSNSLSQEKRNIELTAQGILARVDKIFNYPQGILKGKMKHIKPDGKSFIVRFKGFISKEDFLFKFSNRKRGEQLKVLYNLSGEDIWVYNIHALKLFHKLGIDKYDQILGSNFTYIDLSNADFQSNYSANIVGNAFVKGIETYRLQLDPIYKGGEYGQLTLYVSKNEYVPIRIDYFDRDKAIFKFMTISKTMEKGNRIIPIKYDMMDIRKGTVTIISFIDFNFKAKLNKSIFRSDKLGE